MKLVLQAVCLKRKGGGFCLPLILGGAKMRNSVFSVHMCDEHRYYINTSGKSSLELCKAYAGCRLPFVEMSAFGQLIEGIEYSFIQQSSELDFSVEFNVEKDMLEVFDGDIYRRQSLSDFCLNNF